ncbi:hypothetical protein E1A91_D13G255500v1 [Gossypium mustelinum]|uniref:Uncharacterized protein n=1 Tax=Gossypium mustelinum TaxID=34275 RepID=A0A5D2S9Y5_GOSMU|nr:hypothetical protein E1A91_D13G255500v1 [Gossypium mustelinum]
MARYYRDSYMDYLSLPPLHLCFFISILFFVLGFSWYLNYESVLEDFMNQLKFFLMLAPIVLLLLLHCFSGRVPSLIPEPEKDSLHRAGGSPWGVALVLVLLLYMISYQSFFHERWFPFGV